MAQYREIGDAVDLVILDLVMPEMGGVETFRALKAINPDVPVLVSSGHAIDGDARLVLEEGARGFLQKPYDRTALLAKLTEVLERD